MPWFGAGPPIVSSNSISSVLGTPLAPNSGISGFHRRAHSAAVNGNLAPTALRIERDRRQLIVRRDQPQTPAPCSSRGLFGLSKQGGRDVLAFLQREQNDNFALTSGHVMQEQSHRLAGFLADESRQVVGQVQDASGDDSRGGECLAHDPAHPRTICHSYRSNLHTHCIPDAGRPGQRPQGEQREPAVRCSVMLGGRHWFVYSITSSARESSDRGMVMPSPFAVFKLTTSSNTRGCSIGRSPAFAPLKIRST
jgi:hypothetical protein